jgi:transcriptional regulator with XRE-family HTH domain
VAKERFGDLVRRARIRSGLSLREAAARARIDYSRLSRIENGSRPAPGMNEMRPIADLLHLDLLDLAVAAGVSREVMEDLIWSERLRSADGVPGAASYRPGESRLVRKNRFVVPVEERDGALCRVRLGDERLRVLSFSDRERLEIEIPPESVVVYAAAAEVSCGSLENVFCARVHKQRRLGQVTNLVLEGAGFEVNTLHSTWGLESMRLNKGDGVIAAVPVTAIRTSPLKEEVTG